MQRAWVKLYNGIPIKVKRYFRGKSWFKGFKNVFLFPGGTYREVNSWITRHYEGYDVHFKFYGSVQIVSKASKNGIENTLLKNTFKLLNTKKGRMGDGVIVDIGANFGFLSMVWANSICKNGKVIAFEPNKQVFDTFCKSVNNNKLDEVILPLNLAVGSENKMIKLYLNNSTSNVMPEKKTETVQNVKMVTLDNYLSNEVLAKCDLIKIDVDGIEIDILKGCVKTIQNFKPLFVVETNNDLRIIQFFEEYDYKILDMKLEEYVPNEAIPLNIFCMPN